MRSAKVRFSFTLCLVLTSSLSAMGQSTAQLESWTTANGLLTAQRANQVLWVGDQLFVTNRPRPIQSAPNYPYYFIYQDEEILVYDLPAGSATQPAPTRLPVTNPTQEGFFGNAMATTSNFFFAGVERDFFAGTVRVYQNQAGTWTEVQTLTPPNGGQSDRFGSSLAAANSNHLVVGAAEANRAGVDSGTAYIFEFDGSAWTFDQEIQPSDGEQDGNFGRAIATDGSTVFVGAPRTSISDRGAVYVFDDGPGGWTEVQKLQPVDLLSGQRFGTRIVVDGGRLFVGAPLGAGAVGAIYVFERVGGSWQQAAKILPVGFPLTVSLGAWVGSSFDVQGTRLACGIFNYNLDASSQAGSIFLFDEIAGSWTFTRQLSLSDQAPQALLGASLDFNADGRLAAGAPGRFTDSYSEAMLFESNLQQVMFCFGRGLSGNACADCPCSNNTTPASFGGCVHSAGRSAQLRVSGVASASSDTLDLEVIDAMPGTFALLLSSAVAVPSSGTCQAGGTFDPAMDGLRCLGAQLLRHGIRRTDSEGNSLLPWGASGSSASGLIGGSGWTAGQTRNFQAYYRELEDRGCMTGIGTTNAVRVEIRP